MNYSVAIRTLGNNPYVLKKEIESISRQTVLPDKVIIYIAEGYPKPDFNIMGETYVETPKGMVAQRAIDYKEINSKLIMLLDDDVELATNSAEILISELISSNVDCVAADTFKNHEMSILSKIKAGIGNWVFPHYNQKWAFKLKSNGSFSYINNPVLDCYPSQSAAGPASLWRKKSLLSINFKDEEWLDRLGFAYGEDEVFFYKLILNGGKLLVSFNSNIKNLDGKSSSGAYHRDLKKFYIRSKANIIKWYRIHYQVQNSMLSKLSTLVGFILRTCWLTVIYGGISFLRVDYNAFANHISGTIDGVKFIKSSEYSKIPSYRLK